MKKLIFTLLVAATTGLNAQIMVVNEIETESSENFSSYGDAMDGGHQNNARN